MNDEFLYRFRETPRAEFAAGLYRRLSRPPRTPARLSAGLPPVRRWAWALATLSLVCAVSLVASPSMRAMALQVMRAIGGINFEEAARQPIGGDIKTRQVRRLDVMTLAEARAALPFPLLLPTWLPEGFGLVDDVAVDLPPADGLDRAAAILSWRGTAGEIRLFAQYPAPPADNPGEAWTMLVGPGSVEEVEVNGQPAGLVRGEWDDASGQWQSTQRLSLYWVQAGAVYSLVAWEDQVSVEALVRLAESLR